MFVKSISHKVFVYFVMLMQISRNLSSEFISGFTELVREAGFWIFEGFNGGNVWLEDSDGFRAKRSVHGGV
jgi:hypothetical protein